MIALPYKKSRLRKRLFTFASILMASLSLQAFADVPKLQVRGNTVLVGGQAKSLGGNSFFWSNNGWGGEKYYTPEAVAWLKKDWQSSLVRAAMGVDESGGYLQDPHANKNKVKRVVEAAIANDLYVIIDWHSHHAENNPHAAIQFFSEMAQNYGQHNHVIYELYNEPLQVSWSHTIKPYAEAVIDAIRQYDPDNLIVVGTPNWSQNVDEAAADPINDHNTGYALHFYAGTHGEWLRQKASRALSMGAALFVTEWGTVNANGDGGVNHGETDAWVQFMRQHHIHHANWAINDKREGASALHPGASPTGGWQSLTASGQKARQIIRSSDKIGGSGSGGSDQEPSDCESATATHLPATLQAEDYCQMKGVRLENTSDQGGGQNVGWISTKDWMAYRVSVPETGQYKVNYRVASLFGGGKLQLENKGGQPVLGSLDIPRTNGWQNWRTIEHTVTLQAGEHSLAISALRGGFNINWFKLEKVSDSTEGPDDGSEQPGPNFSITIEAEDYAWMKGVKTEPTSDIGGGRNVGWISTGDWFSFPEVNIPEAGVYTIEYRVASLWRGGSLQFDRAGGDPIFNVVSFGPTFGWQNWKTIKQTVELPKGRIPFGIYALKGGWNLNWIKISAGRH